MHIAVVGGGIVGAAVTHALLDEGHTVVLVDKDGSASAAARGNAGWIAHLDIQPLASPKVWRNLAGWALDPLGPLSIAPSYLPKLVPWLARFVAASRPSRIAANSAAIRAIQGLSMPAWERRFSTLGLDGLVRRRGILDVWTDASAFASSAALHERMATLGIPIERLDNAGVRRIEPAFGPAIAGGAFFPTGAHIADPAIVLTRLREIAALRQARLVDSAALRVSSTPGGVAIALSNGENLETERVVISAGAWSKALAAQFGDDIPLDTERGYNITLATGALGLTRPVMHVGLGIATTPLDTGDRIGGSVEFAGLDAPPNWARVDAILARLKRTLPDVSPGTGTRWMGFRPSLPDSRPVIGRARGDARVFYAFGHGHHGLTQAAATAEVIAALIADRAPPIDAALFSPTRF
ncbi:MAG: FAD-dependent oxidoreductase [Alphaproteobacteria bacterium]|nr:FAD-dependent oxidoreductase [Alphaproteobacteria bacterium]